MKGVTRAVPMRSHARSQAVLWTLALSLASGAAHGLPPGVRVVNHLAPAGGNGLSWATAYDALQDALAEAHTNPGTVEQIWVAKGTYTPATDHTLPGVNEATFFVNDVELYGGFAGGEVLLEQRDYVANLTILSGDLGSEVHIFHVVTVSDTESQTILDGFVITGGRATDDSPHGPRGGGIRMTGGSPLIRNCIITGNSATVWSGQVPLDSARGGGVFAAGDPTFESCHFANNSTSGMGGGVSGTATFNDCIFLDNFALYGGGGVSGGGTFNNCEFRENRASIYNQGGGAVNGSGTFTDCDFLDNQASFDAGAVSGGGTFIRCVFMNNLADTGAIGLGTFNLIDCHFENNLGFFTGFWMATINAIGTTFIGNDSFVSCSVNAENCTFVGSMQYHDPLFWNPSGLRLVNSVVRQNSNRGVTRITQPGEFEIINSTIIANVGSPGRAALTVDHAGALLRVHNSVVWDHGSGTQEEQISVVVGAVDIQNSVIQGWDGTLGGGGNFGFDPVFADAEGRPGPGSPLIDAGNNTLVPSGIAIDLDGNPRFVEDPGTPNLGVGQAPLVDIGAFEFQGTTCYADCDGSGTLNIDDFLCFIDRFSRGHPLANCDASTTPPLLTIDDFICFTNAFAAGCP